MTTQTAAAGPEFRAEDEQYPNSVLGKAQLLLGAFESGAVRLRLTELSRRSGVSKASAYRLAQELVYWGLLERRGEAYQLGMRLFELGQRVPASAVLRSVARPALIDLHTATRGTIHLAVLDGGHVLYLEKIAGEANVHSHSAVGGRLPASCTATGKVLLALSESGRAQLDLLAAEELPRLTSRTVTSLGELHRQLAQIRGRGFAVEVEETMPQYGSIAVPVVGSDGGVLAAVSVTESASRLTVRRLLPELRSAAATVARAVDRAVLAEGDGALSPSGRASGPRAGAAAAGPSPARLPCVLPSRTVRAAG